MSISVEDLKAAGIDHLITAVEDAITEYRGGWSPNVAVVAEQFAGRDVLLDDAHERLDTSIERVTFDAVVAGELPEFPDCEVVFVDNCHYLYTRQIGGFDVLDGFLERIAASDTMFVTSWNRYAWNYLIPIRNVDEVFATTLTIPSLSADRMAELLTSNYATTMPEFVQTDAGGRVKTIGFERHAITLPGNRQVDLTLPELNVEYLASRDLSTHDDIADVEAVVFQKIAQLSKGNPGVATVLWERSIRDGTIAPAYIEEVDRALDLTDHEAFVLAVVLAKERIARATLADILAEIPVHRALQNLTEQGVLAVDEGRVTIAPEALYAIDTTLRRRRLIW